MPVNLLPAHRSCLTGLPGVCRRGRVLMTIGVAWLLILGTGFFVLAREEFTPVVGADPLSMFPPGSALKLEANMPTLILFVHPHCPCTRATLRELDSALSGLDHRVTTTIVFTVPEGVAPHWEQGELWQSVARMPGVRAAVDQDGREARRFGVKGSGHALLFQPSGRLVFSGGITPSRGHDGDNPGRSAIVNLVLGGRAPVSRTPVFGCPLLETSVPASL